MPFPRFFLLLFSLFFLTESFGSSCASFTILPNVSHKLSRVVNDLRLFSNQEHKERTHVSNAEYTKGIRDKIRQMIEELKDLVLLCSGSENIIENPIRPLFLEEGIRGESCESVAGKIVDKIEFARRLVNEALLLGDFSLSLYYVQCIYSHVYVLNAVCQGETNELQTCSEALSRMADGLDSLKSTFMSTSVRKMEFSSEKWLENYFRLSNMLITACEQKVQLQYKKRFQSNDPVSYISISDPFNEGYILDFGRSQQTNTKEEPVEEEEERKPRNPSRFLRIRTEAKEIKRLLFRKEDCISFRSDLEDEFEFLVFNAIVALNQENIFEFFVLMFKGIIPTIIDTNLCIGTHLKGLNLREECESLLVKRAYYTQRLMRHEVISVLEWQFNSAQVYLNSFAALGKELMMKCIDNGEAKALETDIQVKKGPDCQGCSGCTQSMFGMRPALSKANMALDIEKSYEKIQVFNKEVRKIFEFCLA